MVRDDQEVARDAGAADVKAPQSRADSPEASSYNGQPKPRGSESLVWLVITRLVMPGLLLVGAGFGLVRLRSLITPEVKVAEVVEGLREGGHARWQAVSYITPYLYDQRYEDVRHNPALAIALANTLSEELDIPAQGYQDMSIAAKAHLCRLLHCVNTPEVIPALVKAMQWRGVSSPEMESPIRRAAAEGLFELGDRLGPQVLRGDPSVLEGLLQAVDDPVDPVRAAAALALGLHGGPEACDKLATMLGDPNPSVRYNAAIALAMAGDTRGIVILEELLQCREVQKLADSGNTESINGMRTRRLLVLSLRSVDRLLDLNPSAPLDDLRPAIDRLQYSLVPEDVKQLAQHVQVKLSQRPIR